MNVIKPLSAVFRYAHAFYLYSRKYLPRQRCNTFNDFITGPQVGIQHIYVINLDRQPLRWDDVRQELSRIIDSTKQPISKRTIRHSACDARSLPNNSLERGDVDPYYTLAEQLFVEPQPRAVPDTFDLEMPIRMSKAEIAVARSHIDVWRRFLESDSEYALILEDDVLFERGFGKLVDKAWREIRADKTTDATFDVLYLSYKEVLYGAPKELVSRSLFRPERGLWYMSGYVLSKRGAMRLLELLPCRGPIDLWINHKFPELEVKALRRSMISQRLDLGSTNSYSILPMLTRLGVIDASEALFQLYPKSTPVFAFGEPGSGLSSLAMALSMLGYRCCSDLDRIPRAEMELINIGSTDRVFNAYVNIRSLIDKIPLLRKLYPNAKFIITANKDNSSGIIASLHGTDVAIVDPSNGNPWRALCEHLRIAPPQAEYPFIRDSGQRIYRESPIYPSPIPKKKLIRHDTSPWIVPSKFAWPGISVDNNGKSKITSEAREVFTDEFIKIRQERWKIRTDTFPGNQALFRTRNANLLESGGIQLIVQEEKLGVREFSAAAITSSSMYQFGRFEVTLQATNVAGLVTGFFLYRDSPRQEIDIEITGDCPDYLLVNVFYNPGTDGAKFDYGYRGTPVAIALGFDASKAAHHYAIEWNREEIRWYVDDKLIHRRVLWNPTPIPDLPMALHANTWPTRSKELAGRLKTRSLPAYSVISRICVDANEVSNSIILSEHSKEGVQVC